MPVSNKHLKNLLKKKTPKTVLLAKWPGNKLYYLVNLIKIDPKKNQCLVEYEDKTEAWARKEDLHLQFCSMNSPYQSDEDIVCCVCDGSKSEEPNEIIICDVCQQGYHQDCHNPAIDPTVDRWSCEICDYILGQSNSGPVIAASTPRKVPIELPVDDSINDSSSGDDSGDQVKHLGNGITMEKTEPAIINVAKALVEKEVNAIGTNNFVESISPDDDEIAQPSKVLDKNPEHIPMSSIDNQKTKKIAPKIQAKTVGRIPRKASAVPRAA